MTLSGGLGSLLRAFVTCLGCSRPGLYLWVNLPLAEILHSGDPAIAPGSLFALIQDYPDEQLSDECVHFGTFEVNTSHGDVP